MKEMPKDCGCSHSHDMSLAEEMLRELVGARFPRLKRCGPLDGTQEARV